MTIKFSFEGKDFEVADEAYEKEGIVLPDGRLLKADGWLESLPPIPTGLRVEPHLFQKADPTEIAEQFNAIVAKALEK